MKILEFQTQPTEAPYDQAWDVLSKAVQKDGEGSGPGPSYFQEYGKRLWEPTRMTAGSTPKKGVKYYHMYSTESGVDAWAGPDLVQVFVCHNGQQRAAAYNRLGI